MTQTSVTDIERICPTQYDIVASQGSRLATGLLLCHYRRSAAKAAILSATPQARQPRVTSLPVTEVHCGPRPYALLSPDRYRSLVMPLRNRSRQIPMAAIPATPQTQIAKRRSNRVALNTPVGLSGHDRQMCPFTMTARATNLNRHGAVIQVSRDLLVGSIIVVRNPRGTQVSGESSRD
jgi:hypothetical protein